MAPSRTAPSLAGLLLVAPALAVVILLFVVPLASSVTGSFATPEGPGLGNFRKAFELYWTDMVFSVVIILVSTALIVVIAIAIAFVWKQMPFVTLLTAGAMASLDRSTIEAARNLGASRLRILLEIVVPQVAATLLVGAVLSLVTMMSVLSVPLMINAQSPTMITADMAFRINSYGDYGVANALGLISLAFTGAVAWIYLKQIMKENAR